MAMMKAEMLEHMLMDPFERLRMDLGHTRFAKQQGIDCCRPAMDIWQTPQGMTVQVELPGMKKSDVDLAINDNMLIVSGMLDGYKCVDDKCACVHSERRCGSFRRQILIPRGVKHDEVKAEMAHGLLKLRVPKHGHECEAHKINIA